MLFSMRGPAFVYHVQKSYQEHRVPTTQQVGKEKCINFSCYLCTPGDKCCQEGDGQEDQDDSIPQLNLYQI